MPVPDPLPFERPLGLTPTPGGRTTARIWAPNATDVVIRLGGKDTKLKDAGFGVFEGQLAAAHGETYEVVLDGARGLPDPCTRHQPDGLRGPSAVVDPAAFAWTDDAWDGVTLADAVIYELHVGTFTDEGTLDSAATQLDGLAELGVTMVELMPLADFPGEHGWGYDGVYHWAVHRSYGGPDALARFVDRAHALGIGVVVDVVYNHVGASGEKALRAFGPYFTDKYGTFWGQAINYDDADSGAVREWVLQGASRLVADYHLDGLRLDAIHAIYDLGASPILAELATRVHEANPRALIIAESGRNDPQVMRPQAVGGLGHDAAWADDFHHALKTLLTGEKEGYYEEFGRVADLAKTFRVPFLHDGSYSTFRRKRFGAPAPDVPAERHVVFSSNHDQVGNRAFGDRLPKNAKALAAFATLLSPFTPMLWMGDEHGDPAPFQFFSDHIDKKIATATREGRRREFAAFAAFAGEEVPDPQDPSTFRASKLTWTKDEDLLKLHRALLTLRRELKGTDTEVLGYDERARWLRVRRGPVELAMSFARRAQDVPVAGSQLVLGTHAKTSGPSGGVVRLPALAGAVVR